MCVHKSSRQDTCSSARKVIARLINFPITGKMFLYFGNDLEELSLYCFCTHLNKYHRRVAVVSRRARLDAGAGKITRENPVDVFVFLFYTKLGGGLRTLR